ncbi:uncharacterized protein LOC117119930 [Anneissia japonica]|uniref:uncharacterized protein LOC117119930 n=1 Tax=Anneissia japonica TaxID=1529436 RepID=UPI001425605C|nr:uncharacterized protein LOC117119930 [Anneissia japonica]
MRAALYQRGYIRLAEQLRDDFCLPENFSGFLHDDDLMLISNGIGIKYPEVAVRLGLTWSDVSSAKTQHHRHIFYSSMELLTKWRQRQTHSTNQLQMMCEALEHEGFSSVVKQLRPNVEASSVLCEVCLDDKTLLSICDEMKSDWKLVGVQLGLQLSEIDCIEKDNKPVKNAIMKMLVSWRDKQPSNINQLTTMSSALAERGYSRLSDQLTGNWNYEEVYSGRLDDKSLLSICDEIKGDWKLVGVQLGLQLSELDCIEKDNKPVKNAIMKMLVSWRDKQPSNINQLTTMSSALAQRGYNWLSEQLKGNFNPEEEYSDHKPSACALCSLCSDDEFSLPNLSNVPHECTMDEQDFRGILLKISENLDEEDLWVLKVALTDLIKDAHTRVEADRATELFESLIKQNILNPNDMSILPEVFQLTGLNYLQRFIKGCPQVKDIPITFFSKFRQSVVAFGRALTASLTREIEYAFFGTEKLYKNKWDLMMKLEMNLKLCNNDKSIESFKAKFSNHVSK